jgi:hypothetical protein
MPVSSEMYQSFLELYEDDYLYLDEAKAEHFEESSREFNDGRWILAEMTGAKSALTCDLEIICRLYFDRLLLRRRATQEPVPRPYSAEHWQRALDCYRRFIDGDVLLVLEEFFDERLQYQELQDMRETVLSVFKGQAAFPLPNTDGLSGITDDIRCSKWPVALADMRLHSARGGLSSTQVAYWLALAMRALFPGPMERPAWIMPEPPAEPVTIEIQDSPVRPVLENPLHIALLAAGEAHWKGAHSQGQRASVSRAPARASISTPPPATPPVFKRYTQAEFHSLFGLPVQKPEPTFVDLTSL